MGSNRKGKPSASNANTESLPRVNPPVHAEHSACFLTRILFTKAVSLGFLTVVRSLKWFPDRGTCGRIFDAFCWDQ